ncbi:elongator complex protein 4 [Pyricularia oryzae Y34]|uniref:Elongator complex protein 4 n=2 Tax=Pyricularia oryzae TaxID=318829 RepID=A0AA97NSC7_PYRO3|nr:elongator complex protein 4 [Pyricularia oryzae Y34]
MSFRKRNAVISAVPSARPDGIPLRPGQQQVHQPPQAPPGLRPSPLDGRLTTSTGTASLDTLLAGHAGLPLGTSLLVEEQGTTDFSGVLLRYYAAEGLVQGHHVHALAFPEAWKYELPALSYVSKSSSGSTPSRTFASADSAGDKMKIAWSLLSPTLYPGSACDPTEVLQFLHSLRGLLRLYNKQLTALLTLPVSLYPRASGLTRWMELLCDGVMELIPLPSVLGAGALPAVSSGSGKDKKDADKAQGIVKVYTMPVFHERGGGGSEGNHFRDNLSFSLSSSRGLVITPYSLPPMEDDDQKEKSPASTVKDGIDF